MHYLTPTLIKDMSGLVMQSLYNLYSSPEIFLFFFFNLNESTSIHCLDDFRTSKLDMISCIFKSLVMNRQKQKGYSIILFALLGKNNMSSLHSPLTIPSTLSISVHSVSPWLRTLRPQINTLDCFTLFFLVNKINERVISFNKLQIFEM